MYQTHQLYRSDPSTIYIRPNNYIYQSHLLYLSDSSTIYIRHINLTHLLFISDPSPIYIRSLNYIYQTHQLYISDPSTIYQTHQLYITIPSTKRIRLINYIYQNHLFGDFLVLLFSFSLSRIARTSVRTPSGASIPTNLVNQLAVVSPSNFANLGIFLFQTN